MQFTYPEFLFALSALSIPIVVHLFNFRRFKKIYFTNVRFLQEIKQDTRSRSRLKHLLILLARLLAVSFLVFAFAQPFIPLSKNLNVATGIKHVSIYIDNSFSMDAVGMNGSLLETAKKKAREIAAAYQPSDRFQLLTGDFEAKQQRIVNREEFLTMVDEVKSSAAVRELTDVISRQSEALKNDKENVSKKNILYEVSDFQKTVSNIESIKEDSTLSINLVPVVATETKNVFIDTCLLATPFVQLNVPSELTVRIKNISDKDAESVPVKLTINKMQRSLASVTVPAHGAVEAKLTFTVSQPAWQQAEVSITDYPVTFDDQFYFSFEVKEHLSVLSINQNLPSPFIDALFKNDPYFDLKNAPAGQIDYSSFSANSLIILDNLKEISSGLSQELKKYLDHGGTVFLFPGEEMNTVSYQNFLQSVEANVYGALETSDDKITYIESKHPVFADVFEKKSASENLDLPLVKKYYAINKTSRSAEEVLMKMQSGNTFLSIVPVGKGKLLQCAVPLNDAFSNFPKHALFVPVMLKAAMMTAANSFQNMVVGGSTGYVLSNYEMTGENVFHLKNDLLKFDIIPESKIVDSKPIISVYDQVKSSGNYQLESEGKLVAVLSFNYDRRESDLSSYNENELKAMSEKAGVHSINFIDADKQLTHTIAQLSEGRKLWKYCVLLALLFLAAEVLLIRYMKA